MKLRHLLLCLLWLPCCCVLQAPADEFPAPVNTQAPGEHPPTPAEMPALFDLPDGFQVTVFAGEPDVQQPVAFDFDDRGRIWVAENYTYSAHGQIDPQLRDRIIILQDTDGDGRHDVRKVFWDQGRMLTGLTWGYQGLWILNNGTLSFIPDTNADDVPDSEPVQMLNGWTLDAGHNFVNGLMWGPDGWLYGRHGITETSYPGTPDTLPQDRQPMNCGIWRFHPVDHRFQIVCNGTTNPWGLDYNRDGQMFMTNNVIGHLWHVVPGAHYERMFGQDFNPYLYELMTQTADHYHWDHSGGWQDSRDGKASHLGGGHSHAGGMIYYGENFPRQYRGKLMMCNTHGRCVNVDRLEPQGAGYVGRHEPNFLTVNTPWFRGIELRYGPAGCVYLSDWSDNGECHDHDGVHRLSGRIYRISYGDPDTDQLTNPAVVDLDLPTLFAAAVSDGQNEWRRRHAARLVQERLRGFIDPSGPRLEAAKFVARYKLDQTLNPVHSPQTVLNTAQLLGSVNLLDEDQCRQLLQSELPQVRAFAITYVAEHPWLHHPLTESLRQQLQSEQSLFVGMAWASALQKFPVSQQQPGQSLLQAFVADSWLADHLEDDRKLELMAWYALEPSIPLGPTITARSATIRYFTARKLATDWQRTGSDLSRQLAAMLPSRSAAKTDSPDVDQIRTLLTGIRDGLSGRRQARAPANWNQVSRLLNDLGDPQITELTRELSVVFGDGRAIAELWDLLADRDGDHVVRTNAVVALAQTGDSAVIPLFLGLLNDRAVYVQIARSLAAFDDPRIPAELIRRWDSLRHGSREAAIDTLISRPSYAFELARAIESGRVDATELTATQVRQMLAYDNQTITEVIQTNWGIINDSSAAKAAAVASWKQDLSPEVLQQADLDNGARLFEKSCGNCHRLYGQGGRIGPDLTGGNRNNMDYLLGNIIDPSAEVPRQFTTSVLVLDSGRVITGVVIGETLAAVTVQTDKDQLVIPADQIQERVRTSKSLMPDGLLDPLTAAEVRDLIAYVQHRR